MHTEYSFPQLLTVLVIVASALWLIGCSDKGQPVETASPTPAPSVSAATSAATTPAAPTTPASPGAKPPPPAQDPKNGPWNRDLQLYRSADGLTFTGATSFVERAGVPCIIRDSSGRLVAVFQWFPFDNKAAFDRVAVAFSSDEGATWTTPAMVEVSGMPGNLMRPFDPTVVQLADGRYRLYFTSSAQGPGGEPAIYSAVSTDALHYAFEEGARFAPAGGTVDASVVSFGGQWHLFSHNQKANTGLGFHAVSSDGLTFQQLAGVDVGAGRQWIGNAVVAGGTLRYFGSGQGGIWSASSADGARWTLDSGIRVVGGDPSAVVLGDGQMLLVVVGELRSDAGPAP